MKKVFLGVFILMYYAYGQSVTVIPTITEADIINAAVLVDPLAEKVKDISPSNFSLMIQNNKGVDVYVDMYFEAHVTLEEDQQRVLIASGYTTHPFLIPPAGRIFTSKDADSKGSDIDINANVNEDEKKILKDKILDPSSGGRVPSGLYEIFIRVTVDSVGGTAVRETPIEISRSVNVTNPTTAVLDIPDQNGYVYPTPFPQFQWTYDTRSVRLSVYEKRPEYQSLEDAISASDPYLEVEINRKESGNLTTFTYPQTAASRPGITFIKGPRQLERGKMYVAVLDGITTAFGFDVDPLRTIRSFVIADPQGQVMLNLLQNIFGTGNFEDTFNSIQDGGLTIDANGITLNGVRLSVQDLSKILTDNKDRITSVRFEDQ